jgi:hypothetical protein
VSFLAGALAVGDGDEEGASPAEATAAIGCKDASWLHAWPCCSLSLDSEEAEPAG